MRRGYSLEKVDGTNFREHPLNHDVVCELVDFLYRFLPEELEVGAVGEGHWVSEVQLGHQLPQSFYQHKLEAFFHFARVEVLEHIFEQSDRLGSLLSLVVRPRLHLTLISRTFFKKVSIYREGSDTQKAAVIDFLGQVLNFLGLLQFVVVDESCVEKAHAAVKSHRR